MGIMEYLVWLLVGYVVWSVVFRSLSTKATNDIEPNELVVYIEKRAGVYYAYQDPTKLFLAQGNTLTEMVERIVQRTHTKKFVISPETDEAISNGLVEL